MKQTNILRHIHHYASTGIIDDALIPYYDQHGKWRRDKIKWQRPDLARESVKMRDSFLPSSRRTRTTRSGTVLRTTFYCQGDESLMIKYSSIEGSLIINGSAVINAANLRHVGGHLVTRSNTRIYLPYLTSVGGNFETMDNFSIKAPRLRNVVGNMIIAGQIPPKLEFVGGRLGVDWSFECHAPRLRYVGGCLVPHKCTKLVVPLLETIGESLVMTHAATKVEAPRLCSVGGDFLAGSVAKIRAPSLRSITGDADTSSATDYYHPAIKVGGQWKAFPGLVEHWALRLKVIALIRGTGEPLYL